MIYVTRKEHFNAAHQLWNPEWTEEKNVAFFGKCANKNWHGHNFELYVTLKGNPNPETGFVMDLKEMSNIIQNNVIELVDHKNLNLDVPFMKGKMASTENLCIAIWDILYPLLKRDNCVLYKLTLYETPRNFVEYLGE